MLVIALVLALIGLAALVFAVVTSNVLVAWVCIGASVLGVLLLIVDALRERRLRDTAGQAPETAETAEAAEPAEAADAEATETGVSDPEDQGAEDYPDEAPHENSAEAAPDALDDGEQQEPAQETAHEPTEPTE